MSDLFVCIGMSVASLCVCIVGCSFMLHYRISDLTREIRELRMDLKQGEDDDEADY